MSTQAPRSAAEVDAAGTRGPQYSELADHQPVAQVVLALTVIPVVIAQRLTHETGLLRRG